MPATQSGVYHNLKESKYVTSDTEVTFFFSSRVKLQKFLERYKEKRDETDKRFKRLVEKEVNVSLLSDLILYEQIQKHNKYALLRGEEIEWQNLQKYALENLTDSNIRNWKRVSNVR